MSRPPSSATPVITTTTSTRHRHLSDEQPPTLSPLSPISPWPPVVSSPIPSRAPTPDSAKTDYKGPSHDSDATFTVTAQTKDELHLPNATDVYSSIAILSTYSFFFLYVYWAIAPEEWTTWLPDRQWALIVPCYLMIIVLLTYWSYAALVLYRTPDFSSPSLMTDPYSGIPSIEQSEGKEKGEGETPHPYYWKYAETNAVPEAVDLPIDLVGRVLYPRPSFEDSNVDSID